MHLSTAHESLPDASALSDILSPELTAISHYDGGTLRFEAIGLPPIRVSSGRITASDGYIWDNDPFTQGVPIGNHPLTLGIALINEDQRIAFAQIRFSPGPAVRWSMGLVPGQDASSLEPDSIFGYGVDSGTGSLGDSKAYELVSGSGIELANRMMEESRKVYRHTRDWLTIETPAGSMAIFSSGYGDGLYASYFGHSVDGEVVSLVADFGIAKWAGNP
jgi:hypothetical protein